MRYCCTAATYRAGLWQQRQQHAASACILRFSLPIPIFHSSLRVNSLCNSQEGVNWRYTRVQMMIHKRGGGGGAGGMGAANDPENCMQAGAAQPRTPLSSSTRSQRDTCPCCRPPCPSPAPLRCIWHTLPLCACGCVGVVRAREWVGIRMAINAGRGEKSRAAPCLAQRLALHPHSLASLCLLCAENVVLAALHPLGSCLLLESVDGSGGRRVRSGSG